MSMLKLLYAVGAIIFATSAIADQPIEKVKKPSLILVDSAGNGVGVFMHISGFEVNGAHVVIAGNNQLVWLQADTDGFVNVDENVAPSPPEVNPGRYPPQGVLFDLPDCKGTPYMRPWDNSIPPIDVGIVMQPVHGAVGDKVVFAYDVSGYYDASQQIDLNELQSTLMFDGTCEEGIVSPREFDLVSYALPAIAVTDLRPFSPPFHFEVR